MPSCRARAGADRPPAAAPAKHAQAGTKLTLIGRSSGLVLSSGGASGAREGKGRAKAGVGDGSGQQARPAGPGRLALALGFGRSQPPGRAEQRRPRAAAAKSTPTLASLHSSRREKGHEGSSRGRPGPGGQDTAAAVHRGWPAAAARAGRRAGKDGRRGSRRRRARRAGRRGDGRVHERQLRVDVARWGAGERGGQGQRREGGSPGKGRAEETHAGRSPEARARE